MFNIGNPVYSVLIDQFIICPTIQDKAVYPALYLMISLDQSKWQKRLWGWTFDVKELVGAKNKLKKKSYQFLKYILYRTNCGNSRSTLPEDLQLYAIDLNNYFTPVM